MKQSAKRILKPEGIFSSTNSIFEKRIRKYKSDGWEIMNDYVAKLLGIINQMSVYGAKYYSWNDPG